MKSFASVVVAASNDFVKSSEPVFIGKQQKQDPCAGGA
jgi:hypothetical protein